MANHRARQLRDRAGEARELARICGNARVAENILSYAAELEREAEAAEIRERQNRGPAEG